MLWLSLCFTIFPFLCHSHYFKHTDTHGTQNDLNSRSTFSSFFLIKLYCGYDVYVAYSLCYRLSVLGGILAKEFSWKFYSSFDCSLGFDFSLGMLTWVVLVIGLIIV